jgi:hypothetical protein
MIYLPVLNYLIIIYSLPNRSLKSQSQLFVCTGQIHGGIHIISQILVELEEICHSAVRTGHNRPAASTKTIYISAWPLMRHEFVEMKIIFQLMLMPIDGL